MAKERKKIEDRASEPVANCDQLPEVIDIKPLIRVIRDQQVMIDRDLALLYGVETRRLNEQVKRNIARFPDDFMFQLNKEEFEDWKSHFATSNSIIMGARKLPYAFTEQGIAMLSSVLKSQTAVDVNIRIMRAFVSMRRFVATNAQLFQRLETVEYRQLEMKRHQEMTDKRIDKVFNLLETSIPPIQGIFYAGQVFDAYSFATDLIRSAKKSLLLIDNYIDESVLLMLSKRRSGVCATVYTQKITAQLQLDIEKHNRQYPPVEMRIYNKCHDRFLIIDSTEVYHIGASLKDLGKKMFAFSRLDIPADTITKMFESE